MTTSQSAMDRATKDHATLKEALNSATQEKVTLLDAIGDEMRFIEENITWILHIAP